MFQTTNQCIYREMQILYPLDPICQVGLSSEALEASHGTTHGTHGTLMRRGAAAIFAAQPRETLLEIGWNMENNGNKTLENPGKPMETMENDGKVQCGTFTWKVEVLDDWKNLFCLKRKIPWVKRREEAWTWMIMFMKVHSMKHGSEVVLHGQGETLQLKPARFHFLVVSCGLASTPFCIPWPWIKRGSWNMLKLL